MNKIHLIEGGEDCESVNAPIMYEVRSRLYDIISTTMRVRAVGIRQDML